jgi:hypothetical protein
MEYEKCRDILLQETALIRQIACVQEQIKEAVISRNWIDFDNHFSVLAEIGDEFAVLEMGREALFTQGQKEMQTAQEKAAKGRADETRTGTGFPFFQGEIDSKGRFYAFAARFPAEQRNELTAIYRSLKLETLRVQTAGEAIMSFITGARAALAGFFEIAFPDRGGKIYTPHGKPLNHDMRSMVLNRTF